MPKINNARRIRGWMTPRELRWLARRATECAVVIEVGVYGGRSLRCLADNCDGVVYGVDHWQGNPSSLTHQKQFETVRKRDKFISKVKKNFEDHLDSGKVVILEMESQKAALLMQTVLRWRGGADLIFLDADHSTEAVMQDIETWRPLLAEDGMLCGHDYKWPSVQEAVKRSLPSAKHPTENIWCWQS